MKVEAASSRSLSCICIFAAFENASPASFPINIIKLIN